MRLTEYRERGREREGGTESERQETKTKTHKLGKKENKLGHDWGN